MRCLKRRRKKKRRYAFFSKSSKEAHYGSRLHILLCRSRIPRYLLPFDFLQPSPCTLTPNLHLPFPRKKKNLFHVIWKVFFVFLLFRSPISRCPPLFPSCLVTSCFFDMMFFPCLFFPLMILSVFSCIPFHPHSSCDKRLKESATLFLSAFPKLCLWFSPCIQPLCHILYDSSLYPHSVSL